VIRFDITYRAYTPSPLSLQEEIMSDLKFKDMEETESMLKRLRIEKGHDMTEKDVEDFCAWVCVKATSLGFEVRVLDEDKRLD
jgi:hypothetical protein